VADDETASSINDFSVNKAVDEDVGTRLDCQATGKVAPNMQRAVFLNYRVGGDRTVNIRGAADDQWLRNVALVDGRHHNSPRHSQHSDNTATA
jgi:hypothetical protein